jgi:hypothetical protein
MWKQACVLAVAAGIALPAAGTTTITFDNAGLLDGLYAPGEYVSNQYAGLGVAFTSAIALVSQIGLAAEEAPPHSGDTVLSAASLLNEYFPDDPNLPQFGPLTAIFAGTLPTAVGAHFTYEGRVHLSFFDLAGDMLGYLDSRFSSNLVSSGESPNELLEFRSSDGIASVQVVGQGFFVLDDLTFSRDEPTTVPEPSTLALGALGALAGVAGLSRRSRKAKH